MVKRREGMFKSLREPSRKMGSCLKGVEGQMRSSQLGGGALTVLLNAVPCNPQLPTESTALCRMGALHFRLFLVDKVQAYLCRVDWRGKAETSLRVVTMYDMYWTERGAHGLY